MSIPSIANTQTAGVQNSISRTLEASSDIANKLSSGNRIISPSEDPAGLAIGTKLEVNLAVFKEALNSANQALVVLNIAYGGAKSITSILKRLSQLSIMALNGSAGEADKKLTDLEAQQLVKEIDRTAESTKFNGRSLINGSTAEIKIDTVDGTSMKLPTNIAADNNFEFAFNNSQIESSTDSRLNIKLNSGTNKFELSLGSDYEDNSKTIQTKAKEVFTVNSATDVTSITKPGGGALFTIDKSAGTVTSGGKTYNYKSTAGDLPDSITLADGNVLEFKSTGIEASNGLKIEWKSTKFELTVGANYKGATKIETNPKEVFKYAGTDLNSITSITNVAGTALFTLDGATGEVKGSGGNVLYNYKAKPISAFEFKFNLHDNAITDAKGNKLIIYDKQNQKFYLNKNADGNAILDANGNIIYKLEDSGTTISSSDGTKTYFKVDDNADIKNISNFILNGGMSEFILSSDGRITRKNETKEFFVFDKSKQQESSMVFQIGTETTDKISISLDGATSKDLGINKLHLTSYEEAENARLKVESALAYMFNYNATIGAYQSRFKVVAESVSTSIENVDAARAQFLDADFTELTKDFSQNQAKLTASITAQSKLIGTPQKLLGLLQYM